MQLNYANLAFDKDGAPEIPVLMLKTLGDETIGVIPGVFNLKMNIKFSEPSEISFDVPAIIDGNKNWIYDKLSGYKVIYTKDYGIYVTMNPSVDSDGVSEIKHIKGYSIEKMLDSKKFFLEEGTYKFYDPLNQNNPDTIIGRILEIAVGWSVGYVSPTIGQRYRTFSQYDDFLLSFIYKGIPEKYRCVFVFDPYEKSINVYDADEERATLPIYLDFDNLLESVDVEELSDELVTAIRPYGADGLDIREVNPLGTGWIYDLSHFISNGDIPEALAAKYDAWQKSIQNNRPHFEALSALRASITAKLLSAKAKLAELQGELEILTSQQSIAIQSGAKGETNNLTTINANIANKNTEIANQKAEIANIEKELDGKDTSSCVAKINAIIDELRITKYFTDTEYCILSNYLIEQDVTEDTFVATDIDTSVSGSSYKLNNQNVSISGSSITKLDLTSDFGRTMYSLSGGTFSFSGDAPVSGDIIRGTLEVTGSKFVLSVYAGSLQTGDSTASSGMITIDGAMSNFSSNISAITEDGITSYISSSLSFNGSSGTMFLTANINEYKRYSVKMELYEYGVGVLSDLAVPTYEFSVKSGNFLFAKEFAPFRNKLELGKGIYVNIGGKQTITPNIIEFELNFEDKEDFSIVFSNRFKRHDAVNTLSDMIENSYSSSRSFDAGKYIYNQAANQATQVSDFMKSSLDAAVNTIIAASNQSVIIDGSGIHVKDTTDDDCQLRIVNGMIAITDDNWATSKLALGLFKPVTGSAYFGVNAEVIGGKLIVGNNLVIENATDNGVMQFKVDASGAWLNNATFVLQKASGGNIIIDPAYGIIAGNKNLFTTSGTTVTPSFMKDGEMQKDSDGMPTNANFFLDITNGNAYFRGKVMATSGEIGGYTVASGYLYAGSGSNYVALNGGTDSNTEYAMWAGNSSPGSAPFYVKKNGTLRAKNGDFDNCTMDSCDMNTCTIAGAIFKTANNTAMMDNNYKFKADYLNLKGITVQNGSNQTTFKVDSSGNVTISGNITLGSGSAINWANVSETNLTSSAAYSLANAANSNASTAKTNASTALTNASSALTKANALDATVASILDGSCTGTFINNKMIYSPTLIGANIYWGYSGDNGAYGKLYQGTGDDNGKITQLVQMWSSGGIVFEAAGGGMRFETSKGIWLGATPQTISIKRGYNTDGSVDWVTLNDLIANMIDNALAKL